MTLRDPPYLIFNWLVLLCIDSYDSAKTHFAAFFEIYKICILLATLIFKILQIFDNLFSIFLPKFDDFFAKGLCTADGWVADDQPLTYRFADWPRHITLFVDWPRHITLFSARSRLYRNEILHPNTHFAAFFKIYRTI